MKDKDWRAVRGRLRRIRKPWIERLGLTGWDLRYELVDGPIEMEEGRSRVAAQTTTQWEYRTALISYSLPALIDLDDADLEEMIVHEFLHVLVQEMREEGIKHEERVVTELSWALLTTFEAGKKAGADG